MKLPTEVISKSMYEVHKQAEKENISCIFCNASKYLLL